MARPRKMRRLNDAKSEVIAEEILKENPQGQTLTDHDVLRKVVIGKHIPEMRDVVFLNGRDPGVALNFHYCTATHPLKIYCLLHGFTYSLPVEVIEHLESCNEPQYSYKKGDDGHPEQFISGRKYIFSFRAPPRKAA